MGWLATAALATASARAEENMPGGSPPSLRENELSVRVQRVANIGSSYTGPKVAADYGHHVGGPAWLNLQVGFQRGECQRIAFDDICYELSGNVFEMLPGVKLQWATRIPLVPYVKGAAGLVYAFPNGASNRLGIELRGGAGTNYFIFDWLGFGAELGYSVGKLSDLGLFYSEIDVGGGVAFRF